VFVCVYVCMCPLSHNVSVCLSVCVYVCVCARVPLKV